MFNKTYGKWTVLELIPGTRFCKVQCACGNVCTVDKYSIKYGRSTNCGCERVSRIASLNEKDLTGQTFGRLYVERLSHRDKRNKKMYVCTCSCGNSITTLGESLSSGRTKSCGCYGQEQRRASVIKHGLCGTKIYAQVRNRIRRSRKKHVDTTWTHEMEKMLREFMPACILCGMSDADHIKKYNTHLHVDHVLPLSKGFSLVPGNAVVLCLPCNARKGSRPLLQLEKSVADTLQFYARSFKDHWDRNTKWDK